VIWIVEDKIVFHNRANNIRPRSLHKMRRWEERYDLLLVVQSLHGRVGISIVRETNEAEAPAATSIAVLDDNLFASEHLRFCATCAVGFH
jgi:hypothetical protein